MKRVVLTLTALALFTTLALTQAKAPGMTGWVTDAKCASKGGDLSNADCARKCAERGEKLVFVSDQDKKIMSVDNQDALVHGITQETPWEAAARSSSTCASPKA